MFGSRGIDQYRKVEVETAVPEASPHRLVLMLMEGALVAINIAARKIEEGDMARKGEAISKAISLIDEGLRPSLNFEQGGEIAANLDELYNYMGSLLLLGNLRNDTAPLMEVASLLGDIKDAWASIGSTTTPAAPPAGPVSQASQSHEPSLP